MKQLKSELAALDRKIQLELAPPTPEVAEKEKDGQEVKPDAEGVRSISPQQIILIAFGYWLIEVGTDKFNKIEQKK